MLDATGTERAVLVSLSAGAQRALLLAAEHPERVDGRRLHRPGAAAPRRRRGSKRDVDFDERATPYEGWAKYNRHYWLDATTADFLEFFFAQMFTEPHSTKQIEDCVGWGLETTPETLIATQLAPRLHDEAACARCCAARRAARSLVIHGDATTRSCRCASRRARSPS